MSLKAVKEMQTITSEQKNENLSDISYKIKMGTFDEKMGPLCLNAKKGGRCEIRKDLCPGFKCQLIEDAINSKENHLIFRLQDQFVQGIKLKAENPAKRGGIERFILLIKLIQNQGTIKSNIIKQMKEDFLETYNSHDQTFTELDVENFINRAETRLLVKLDTTDVAEENRFYRDKLNIITMNLELLLDEMDEMDRESKRSFLSEALLNVYEMTEHLNKTYR